MSNTSPFRSPLLQPPSPSAHKFTEWQRGSYNTNKFLHDLEHNSFPALKIGTQTQWRHSSPSAFIWPPNSHPASQIDRQNHVARDYLNQAMSVNGIHKQCYSEVATCNINETAPLCSDIHNSSGACSLPDVVCDSTNNSQGRSVGGVNKSQKNRLKTSKRPLHDSYRRYDCDTSKKMRVDEEITNQMIDFHIDPELLRSRISEERLHKGDLDEDMSIDTAQPALTGATTGLHLHLHPDLGRDVLQSQPILPYSIMAEIRKPCMELVLWQPVPSYLPLEPSPPSATNHGNRIPIQPPLPPKTHDFDDLPLNDIDIYMD